jgi:uncharacterized lipoprotein YmbA
MVFKFNATVITAGLIILLTGCASTEELKQIYADRYADKFNQDVAQDSKKMSKELEAAGSNLPKIVNYRASNPTVETCDDNRWTVAPAIRINCFAALKTENILCPSSYKLGHSTA